MKWNALPRLACPDVVRLDGDLPVLVGSRCHHCGEIYFPASKVCTRCCETEMESHPIGSEGMLWSWTIQGFQPKAPYNGGESEQDFEPYGVGYVEMPGGVKVESRLTIADPERLVIGMPLTLTLLPYRKVAGEEPVFTYAFAPVEPDADVALTA